MSQYPDNEKHWAVLSADFISAMAFHGEKKKPEPVKVVKDSARKSK